MQDSSCQSRTGRRRRHPATPRTVCRRRRCGSPVQTRLQRGSRAGACACPVAFWRSLSRGGRGLACRSPCHFPRHHRRRRAAPAPPWCWHASFRRHCPLPTPTMRVPSSCSRPCPSSLSSSTQSFHLERIRPPRPKTRQCQIQDRRRTFLCFHHNLPWYRDHRPPPRRRLSKHPSCSPRRAPPVFVPYVSPFASPSTFGTGSTGPPPAIARLWCHDH
mmetsp:Transcript_37881/g.91354  ORF Transcript_37881/g.91354 Transcript_37881/m.91354 type:complete len:217 (-) Transcript_37881:474-1124(-)